MTTNVEFTIVTHDKLKYMLNENVRLRIELAMIMKQVEHLVVENQRMSSQSTNIADW